jgi:hypothetical protein
MKIASYKLGAVNIDYAGVNINAPKVAIAKVLPLINYLDTELG